jgi:hypothetical protein
MEHSRLQKLCEDLRDADDAKGIRKAAAALRLYLREEQFIVRSKMQPYIEKLFVALQVDSDRTH